ncbi:DUF6191 domain-containing protein [Streptomyces sp. SID3343]|uniref:DUF6191 domain-containing protein n=1 Tax=Streptomyces sp. SID3343 TaxID=2690260 RepID=UPI001371276C|nr:hypothetical protein [Streptomyces sp. SID3343]
MTVIVSALLVSPLFLAVGLRLYWRIRPGRGRGEGGSARPRSFRATGTEEMHALLSPGKRVQLEQRRVESVLRDDDQDGSPRRTGIDLDAGVARIRRTGAGGSGP